MQDYIYEKSGRSSYLRDRNRPHTFFVKDEGTGRWREGRSLNARGTVPPDVNREWGTGSRGVGAIIKAALEGGVIRVTKEVKDENGKPISGCWTRMRQ